MKQEQRTITISKKEVPCTIKQYETLEELMLGQTAVHILELFNYRFAQIQAQEHKKLLKPKKKTIKELRNLAYAQFSKKELQKMLKTPEIFEDELQKKVKGIKKCQS